MLTLTPKCCVNGMDFIIVAFPDGAGKPLGADLKGLTPVHKEAMLLFLERVYGVDNQELFFNLLEVGFLPDLRAATTMDTVSTPFPKPFPSNADTCISLLPTAIPSQKPPFKISMKEKSLIYIYIFALSIYFWLVTK